MARPRSNQKSHSKASKHGSGSKYHLKTQQRVGKPDFSSLNTWESNDPAFSTQNGLAANFPQFRPESTPVDTIPKSNLENTKMDAAPSPQSPHSTGTPGKAYTPMNDRFNGPPSQKPQGAFPNQPKGAGPYKPRGNGPFKPKRAAPRKPKPAFRIKFPKASSIPQAERVRLFAAIKLPEETGNDIRKILGEDIPILTPNKPYHVTLRFLGEVPESSISSIIESISAIKQPIFKLKLNGTPRKGSFANTVTPIPAKRSSLRDERELV
jgi:hypothetical protein